MELLREIKPFWESMFVFQYFKFLDDEVKKREKKNNLFREDQLVFDAPLAICSPSKKSPKYKLKWINFLLKPQKYIDFTTSIFAINLQKETKIPSFKPLLDDIQRENTFVF